MPFKAVRTSSAVALAAAALAVVCAVSSVSVAAQDDFVFRPPAVPLIVFSPYNSFWSTADQLTDDFPRHWSGSVTAMMGAAVIDRVPYRWMGPVDGPFNATAMQQQSVSVAATQTTYVFTAGGVQLTVTFSTPAVPDQLELLSLPITYISMAVQSMDGGAHSVQLYYDIDGELFTIDNGEQLMYQDVSFTYDEATKQATPLQRDGSNAAAAAAPASVDSDDGDTTTVTALRMGTFGQPVLGQSGDFQRIDWGYAYMAAPAAGQGLSTTMAFADDSRSAFLHGNGRAPGSLLPPVNPRQPRAVSDQWPVLAFAWDLGTVQAPASRTFVYAYDEIASMQYFGDNLVPYWHTLYSGASNPALPLLGDVLTRQQALLSACDAQDSKIAAMTESAGGVNYTTITTLAYRQTTGATAVTWYPKRQVTWVFMKEISSDGDVSTVDVIYPSSPFWLLLAPTTLQQMFIPLLEYANNATYLPYPLSWAPHHLGIWPICDLPWYLQEQMPVEETGNLLLMFAAIGEFTGAAAAHALNPNAVPPQLAWLQPYWSLVKQWGTYLQTVLPDPGNQLCTDDFEGPSPHNVNLAAKGIVGVAAYAKLQQWFGDSAGAAQSMANAQGYVREWIGNATAGDHFKLQYNLDGSTWSMKYNLLFQPLLNISTSQLFPQSVFDTEDAWYQSQYQSFGVPLDNRSLFTKTDWFSWVSALSPNSAHRTRVWDSIVAFAHTTVQRVPFTDWYWTTSAAQQGFQARPVLGGLYARALMLANAERLGLKDSQLP